MRIAYVAVLDVSEESGVLKKIITQIKTWISMDHEAYLFALSPKEKAWEGLKLSGTPYYNITHGNLLRRFFSWQRMLEIVNKWQPDIVYYRSGIYYPGFKKLSDRFPVVAEINTFDLDEYKLSFSRAKYFYHRVTRKTLFASCAGLVCVTSELADRYSCFGKPTAIIPNGIDLTNYSPLLPTNNETPRLVFLGSPGCPWHGIDKVLMLAQLCPEFIFDVIGYSLNDVPAHNQLPPNIKFRGFLNTSEYVNNLSKADVAIGSLSLHVNNMNEASPLKVREYLAYGLPVVIGYKDTDFPNGASFLLELHNCEDNITSNVQLIKDFVCQWRGKRVPREEVLHIDVSRKEASRIAFLNQVKV